MAHYYRMAYGLSLHDMGAAAVACFLLACTVTVAHLSRKASLGLTG